MRDSFFSGKAEERGIAPLFYLCIWLTYYEGTIPKEKKEKKNKKVEGKSRGNAKEDIVYSKKSCSDFFEE